MSAQSPNIREELNLAQLNRLADNLRTIGIGDLLSLLVSLTTATEVAAAVAANAMTLADPAAVVLDVVVTAGGSTGRKALLIGGPGIVPTAGQVVWDGSSSLRFAAADAVTAASVWYTLKTSPVTISLMARTLGQRDG